MVVDRNRLSVSLRPKLRERLESHVKSTGLSVSEIVRAALDHYLPKEDN